MNRMRGVRAGALVVRVRLGWVDYSPALHHHITARVEEALGHFAATIREVTVRIADAGGSGDGPPDKRCDLEVLLQPSGALAVSASGVDAFTAVDRAVRRARPLVAAASRAAGGRASVDLSRIA